MAPRISDATIHTIEGIVFAQASLNVYAVIDGAATPALRARIAESDCLSACLNRGELPPDVAAASPWLIQLERDAPISAWFLREGWGQGWGIIALSAMDVATMRRHLRTFMIVGLPDGRLVHFRWYDPRILRAYLPTCDAKEAAILFGPISRYLTEGDEPNSLLQFMRTDDGAGVTPIVLPG
jgi:hypothetical protein